MTANNMNVIMAFSIKQRAFLIKDQIQKVKFCLRMKMNRKHLYFGIERRLIKFFIERHYLEHDIDSL